MNAHAPRVPLQRVALLLALTAFALYLPTLFHSFFADDHIYLAFKNKLLRNTEWHEVYRLLWERANPWEYLPLRDLSYWLDLRIYGTEGMGLHFSNLVWYGLSAASAWLLFREVVRLYQPAWHAQASTLAWCGTVVFLVHPVHVEAVAWVASRKDLMSAAFAFLSSFALLRGIRLDWRMSHTLLAGVLLLCACFSKAAGITMVLFQSALVLAAWRITPTEAKQRKLAALLILLGTAAFAAFVHMKMGATTGIRLENAPTGLEVMERASRILASLVKLLLASGSLGIYHDVYALGQWHWFASLIAVVSGLVAFAALLLRPGLGALGLILTLAPCTIYLQLAPFTTWSLASERFVFISVAGLSLIVMELCGRLSARNSMLLLLAIFLPCSIITWQRIADWEYPVTLYEREYERLPSFHNAIRDRIQTVLLPNKNYAEAERLAKTLNRSYAADAMLAFIAVEQAYKHMNKLNKNLRREEMQAFCNAMASLRTALTVGHATMRHEPDVTYNNLLSTLAWEINLQYRDSEQQCMTRQQPNAT